MNTAFEALTVCMVLLGLLLDITGVILLRLRGSRRKRSRNLFAAMIPWWVLGLGLVVFGSIVAIQAIIALNQAHLLPS